MVGGNSMLGRMSDGIETERLLMRRKMAGENPRMLDIASGILKRRKMLSSMGALLVE